MATPNPQPPSPTLGELGENFVAQWLQTQQYEVLYHRWSCRLGELDLVVASPDRTIALVEVKTRSAGNWDLDGLLAISTTKRNKLGKTAELFLVKHPHLADRVIRFDVALVRCGQQAPQPNQYCQSISAGYLLTLQDYLEDAFRF